MQYKYKHKHSTNSGFVEILLVVLLIVAGVLGYFVYQKYMLNKQVGETSSLINTDSQTSSEEFVPQEDGEFELGSELRKKALTFPAENATEDERREHSRFVAALAETTDIIDLTDCESSPIVVNVRPDSIIKIKNTGNAPVTLFYGNKEHIVSAVGEISLSVADNFGSNPGLYGYACGNKGIVGIIAVGS